MKRRGFLTGLAGILAAGVAPAIVREPMKIWVPKSTPVHFGGFIDSTTIERGVGLTQELIDAHRDKLLTTADRRYFNEVQDREFITVLGDGQAQGKQVMAETYTKYQAKLLHIEMQRLKRAYSATVSARA
ncbi:hypothetical protein D3C71_76930 [compost metagenome]